MNSRLEFGDHGAEHMDDPTDSGWDDATSDRDSLVPASAALHARAASHRVEKFPPGRRPSRSEENTIRHHR